MFHQIFILMTFVVISFDIEANVEFGYDLGGSAEEMESFFSYLLLEINNYECHKQQIG